MSKLLNYKISFVRFDTTPIQTNFTGLSEETEVLNLWDSVQLVGYKVTLYCDFG